MSQVILLIGLSIAALVLFMILVIVRIQRRAEQPGLRERILARAETRLRDKGVTQGMRDRFRARLDARLGDLGVTQMGSPAGRTSPKRRVAVVAGGVAAAVVGLAASLEHGSSHAKEMQQMEINAGALAGTMLSSGQAHEPVVLIVPGSGPTDRDGNNPMGVKASPYRLLAEALADKGIASVRVDKRGMFASKGAGDGNAASIEIYAADYHAWIDAIRQKTGAKCVWLLGHSEGALMVSAAAEGRKDVCGLVLASGAGRPVLDVMREQLQANPANAPLLPEAMHAIDELKAGRHVDTSGMNPVLLRLFAPQVQDFMITAYGADPVEVLRRAHQRALVIQGTTDLQTSTADAKLLAAVPRAKLMLIDGMNHVLKQAPADPAANMATYTNPDLPLAPGVADAIAHFIKHDD